LKRTNALVRPKTPKVVSTARMKAERRRELVDATLAALEHVLERDEHMLLEARTGPVSFQELAEACAALDVSDQPPEWRQEWAEIVEALRVRRTARGGC
jgi:hypothetical protein